MTAARWLASFALMAAGTLPAQPAVRWNGAGEYLARALEFTPAELAAVERGEPVAKTFAVREGRDVAMAAAVAVTIPAGSRAAIRRDPFHPLRAASRRGAQFFSTPAAEADVRQLELSGDDAAILAKCRPRACDFKLPGADMARGRALAAGPDAARDITAYARQRMVAFVNDYRRRGDSALATYDDRDPVHAGEAFASMLRAWAPVHDGLPSTRGAVRVSSPDGEGRREDATVWRIDQITGVRPTLRILHAVLYSPAEFAAASMLVARQLYANHYLEAGLELLLAVESPDGSGVTLIALRRYRFDNLPSGPMNLRGRIGRGLQAKMLGELGLLKAQYGTP